MNDESCRTEPLGIEWEFPPNTPQLVVHVPAREGTFECWDLLADRADLTELHPLQRATIRAWLQVALDRLEPR